MPGRDPGTRCGTGASTDLGTLAAVQRARVADHAVRPR